MLSQNQFTAEDEEDIMAELEEIVAKVFCPLPRYCKQLAFMAVLLQAALEAAPSTPSQEPLGVEPVTQSAQISKPEQQRKQLVEAS